MANRQQTDSVIDDEDEFCPLCIEEFDLSDKNFRPCPCGYQICQFCYNNIKTHSEEGRCPNCRRVYDESTIQYKVPDVDEFKADLQLKHRKAAAAKKKEAEKREIEASSRKNLAGVRVVQKNLVYVIGLNPTIRDESLLLQTLRGKDYFGQYGDIEKIVVSKAKPGGNPNQGIGVYVTFARKADAATCIAAVDGSVNGDRVLRAQYGTTKYCSAFLRNEQCNNRNCTFLHETGEESDSYSRQDLSSMNTLSSQRPVNYNGTAGGLGHATYPQFPHARPLAQAVAQPMRRQGSKDDVTVNNHLDGPALPSSASWANKDAVISRTRRASVSNSQASQSPRPSSVSAFDESKRGEKQPVVAHASSQPRTSSAAVEHFTSSSGSHAAKPPLEAENLLLAKLLKAVRSPEFKFVFSAVGLPAEEAALIDLHPSFIDPFGGVKRRALRVKAEQERVTREQESLQPVLAEEETREGGSLQLGGEPDDAHPSQGRSGRESHGAIQPPSQQGTATNSAIGSPVSAASHQFQGLNIGGRSLTPLQQHQLVLLKSASSNNQQPGLMDQLQTGLSSNTFEQFRQASLPSQMSQFNGLQGQARQSSRFSFGNETSAKTGQKTRLPSGMQSGSPNPLAAPSTQPVLTSNFYTSGVQGPPPGLKTTGTPPISGGGIFAQGHGFTSNFGLGMNLGKQETNPELMREFLRGRSGASASGGLQGHEAGKLDLADPSILQARMHQAGVSAAAGQALYGSQGQGIDDEFPPLGTQPKDKRELDPFGFPAPLHLASDIQRLKVRTGTPSLPPGLPLPTAGHPSSFQDSLEPSVSPPVARNDSTLQRDLEVTLDVRTADVKRGAGTVLGSSRVENSSEISLGSPVSKSANKTKELKSELPSALETARVLSKPKDVAETTVRSVSVEQPKPLNFTLPSAALPLQDDSSGKSDTVTIGNASNAQATASVASSRPNTPLTAVSRASDSPRPRQPRVLRVVDTPKTETPPPTSAPHSMSSIPVVKTRSRRLSLSSMSRPGTPGDFASEYDPYTSASVSRANSPPPFRIGSAPVRSITKSQAKKERRQKAKVAEARQQEVVSQNEEPVQAPIIGRKRKTKKKNPFTAEPSNATANEASGASNTAADDSNEAIDSKSDEASKKAASKEKSFKDTTSSKPVSGEEKDPAGRQLPTEAWRSNNTLEQLIQDVESHEMLQDVLLQRTAPLQVLLSQLHRSGLLNLTDHPLFNLFNLAQRFDMKCSSDDYDKLKRPIELTEEQRKLLISGEPVRIDPDAKSLKDRCLISPRGSILRHLSPEEEERYLTLERNLGSDLDVFPGYPATSITEPDATNRGGGLDALLATPEHFNVRWLDDESSLRLLAAASSDTTGLTATPYVSSVPPNVLSTMEADSPRSNNWAVANTAELANTTAASVRSVASATAKHMLGAVDVVTLNIIPDLEEALGMTDDELRSFATKSQKELELSRKDLDAIDKKLSALVKRNKKLVQQALASGSEA